MCSQIENSSPLSPVTTEYLCVCSPRRGLPAPAWMPSEGEPCVTLSSCLGLEGVEPGAGEGEGEEPVGAGSVGEIIGLAGSTGEGLDVSVLLSGVGVGSRDVEDSGAGESSGDGVGSGVVEGSGVGESSGDGVGSGDGLADGDSGDSLPPPPPPPPPLGDGEGSGSGSGTAPPVCHWWPSLMALQICTSGTSLLPHMQTCQRPC
jgi:hypothetical protein